MSRLRSRAIKQPTTAAQVVARANADFTCRGRPINPLAAPELGVWVSDTDPGPVAIDLLGTHDTNRSFGEYTRQPDGTVFIDLKTTNPNSNAGVRRRERAIMRRRGEIPLGDRYRGAVTVNGDTIAIEADRRGGRSARVIRVR